MLSINNFFGDFFCLFVANVCVFDTLQYQLHNFSVLLFVELKVSIKLKSNYNVRNYMNG